MVQVLLACLNAISSKILGVKYFISILLVLSVFAPTHAQTDSLLVSDTAFHWLTLVREHPQKSFSPDIPPGNFSGITPLGDGLYAVVDDKKGDGFYVFKLRFNKRGSVTSAYNIGFYTSGLVNRDAEDIVYMPSSKTYLCSFGLFIKLIISFGSSILLLLLVLLILLLSLLSLIFFSFFSGFF